MAAKVKTKKQKKHEYRLYSYFDDADGGFSLPSDLAEKFVEAEFIVATGRAEEYHEGVLHAVTQLLQAPAALIHEKAKVLLQEVIDSEEEDDDDSGDLVVRKPLDKDDEEDKEMTEPMPDLTDEEMEAALSEEENGIPMSETELDSWYARKQGLTIDNWHNRLSHAEKYEHYLLAEGGK